MQYSANCLNWLTRELYSDYLYPSPSTWSTNNYFRVLIPCFRPSSEFWFNQKYLLNIALHIFFLFTGLIKTGSMLRFKKTVMVLWNWVQMKFPFHSEIGVLIWWKTSVFCEFGNILPVSPAIRPLQHSYEIKVCLMYKSWAFPPTFHPAMSAACSRAASTSFFEAALSRDWHKKPDLREW